jgi:hypothetical protein
LNMIFLQITSSETYDMDGILVPIKCNYSISNPVDDIVTAKVSFSRNSSLLSNNGRSIRLKQVLQRI